LIAAKQETITFTAKNCGSMLSEFVARVFSEILTLLFQQLHTVVVSIFSLLDSLSSK